MSEIQIKYENNQMLVTSIQIARDFNKEHKNVLKDIRTLIQMGDAQNLADLFHETTYIHEQNKQEYPMYLINRDGFTLLTMGFTGKEALEWKLKYINAFNEMERKLNDPEFLIQRSMQYLNQRCQMLLEQTEQLQIENDEMKPKAIFADAVSTSKTAILVGDLAKILRQNGINIGANRLFSELRDRGYLIKRKGSDWNMPTQKSMDMGLFEIKEHTHIDGNGCNVTTKTPKVTGKGQVYFVNKFLGDRL